MKMEMKFVNSLLSKEIEMALLKIFPRKLFVKRRLSLDNQCNLGYNEMYAEIEKVILDGVTERKAL